MNKKLCVLAGLTIASLSGCMSLDEIGRHMPVIGERCENWQCVTTEGQAASAEKKRILRGGGSDDSDAQSYSSRRRPINGNAAPVTPVEVEEPAPKPKAMTPYDMPPEKLESLPLGGPEE